MNERLHQSGFDFLRRNLFNTFFGNVDLAHMGFEHELHFQLGSCRSGQVRKLPSIPLEQKLPNTQLGIQN